MSTTLTCFVSHQIMQLKFLANHMKDQVFEEEA
jgi:hypothetical protein